MTIFHMTLFYVPAHWYLPMVFFSPDRTSLVPLNCPQKASMSSSPWVIFVASFWTCQHSSGNVVLRFVYSSPDLMEGRINRNRTETSYTFGMFLMFPKTMLPLLAAISHCWFMCRLLSMTTPKVFFNVVLLSYIVYAHMCLKGSEAGIAICI